MKISLSNFVLGIYRRFYFYFKHSGGSNTPTQTPKYQTPEALPKLFSFV